MDYDSFAMTSSFLLNLAFRLKHVVFVSRYYEVANNDKFNVFGASINTSSVFFHAQLERLLMIFNSSGKDNKDGFHFIGTPIVKCTIERLDLSRKNFI